MSENNVEYVESTTNCFPINGGVTLNLSPQEFDDALSPSVLPITIEPVVEDEYSFYFKLKDITIAIIEMTKISSYLKQIRNIVPVGAIDININITSGVRPLSISKWWNITLGTPIKNLNNVANTSNRDYIIGDVYAFDTQSCGSNNTAYIRFKRPMRNSITNNIGAGTNIISSFGSSNFNNLGNLGNLNNLNNSNNLGKCTKIKCQDGNNNISYCSTNNECSILSLCQNVRVPSILITAQTNVNGSDLGDGIFQICDKFKYYNFTPKPIKEFKIEYIDTKDLKQSTFEERNMLIVNVLKGEGKTSCQKISYLFTQNEAELEIDFMSFRENIFTYVVIRYFLSKLLYGNFDMNYLLQKYYEQFLKDLKTSRFCAFLEYFLDCGQFTYGYDKYFKYEL